MGYPAQFVGDGVNFVGYVPYTKDESVVWVVLEKIPAQ